MRGCRPADCSYAGGLSSHAGPAPAPRGQNSKPTPGLTPKPIATSSIRGSPKARVGWLDDVEKHEEDEPESSLAGRDGRPRRVGRTKDPPQAGPPKTGSCSR